MTWHTLSSLSTSPGEWLGLAWVQHDVASQTLTTVYELPIHDDSFGDSQAVWDLSGGLQPYVLYPKQRKLNINIHNRQTVVVVVLFIDVHI